MQRVAIVSGTLGLGTALVFGAAVLASALFPNGGTVQMGWNNGGWERGIPMPAPMPVPAIDMPMRAIEPDVNVEEGMDGVLTDDVFGGTEVAPAQP